MPDDWAQVDAALERLRQVVEARDVSEMVRVVGELETASRRLRGAATGRTSNWWYEKDAEGRE